MDIEHLRYFKTVAETEHITRSAELLHISQPSLSKAISNVETFSHARLFDRDKNKIILNENGKIFLRQLNLFFETLEAASTEIARNSALETGTVRFATSVGSGSLNDYLMALHKRLPDIQLSHQFSAERDMVQALLQKELDLAVSTEPLNEYASQIVSTVLFSEEMLVLVPTGHPLADQEMVSLEQLNHESFVMNNSGMQLRESILKSFRKTGTPPNIIFDSSSPDLVGTVLESGSYLTLIPESTYRRTNRHKRRENKPDTRVALRLSGEGLTRHLYLNYLEENEMSQAALLVLRELPEYFASISK